MAKINFCSAINSSTTYETLLVHVPKPFVYHVELNRPKKLNTFTDQLWSELGQCFSELSLNPECRVVVLTGAGNHFSAGIDLQGMVTLGQNVVACDDIARKSKVIRNWIKNFQDGTSSLEKCSKPVIAVTHNACIGAGVDVITCADIRYCSEDAWFQVKEVKIGMAADMGSLQRLPRIIGSSSLVRELCYTGREMHSKEALDCGLVSKVFPDKNSALNGALQLAEKIAELSPVAVQNTKRSILYSENHSIQDGLEHIGLINEGALQSEDFANACMAQITKEEKPVFSKL